jgi:hypothetical protein
MRVRIFAALATLSAAVVFAGWGTIGTASWSDAISEPINTDPPPPAGNAASSSVTKQLALAAAAASSRSGAGKLGFEASLLSPNLTMAPRAHPAAAQLVQLTALESPEPTENYVPAVTGSVIAAPSGDEARAAATTASSSTPTATPDTRATSRRAVDEKKSVARKPEKENWMLTSAEIGRLRSALRLTPEQEVNWPPVEAELRVIARQLAASQSTAKRQRLALSNESLRRLYWAAGPLIMSLREDQKREVRKLARAMGLEEVAALI